jgi:hypothetical protein
MQGIRGSMTSAAIAEYLDLWEATTNVVFSD